MDRDEDLSIKDSPFNDAAERQDIRAAAIKAHRTWRVTRHVVELLDLWPILWKVMAVAATAVVWWNNGGAETVSGFWRAGQ